MSWNLPLNFAFLLEKSKHARSQKGTISSPTPDFVWLGVSPGFVWLRWFWRKPYHKHYILQNPQILEGDRNLVVKISIRALFWSAFATVKMLQRFLGLFLRNYGAALQMCMFYRKIHFFCSHAHVNKIMALMFCSAFWMVVSDSALSMVFYIWLGCFPLSLAPLPEPKNVWVGWWSGWGLGGWVCRERSRFLRTSNTFFACTNTTRNLTSFCAKSQSHRHLHSH